jgi:hypothetical protein
MINATYDSQRNDKRSFSMLSLMKRLWNDDEGAIISVEWILVVVVLLFGLIPGLVAVRNGTDATMATIANLLLAILPSFTFSGYEIGRQENILAPGTGGAQARAGGYAFSTDFLSNPPDDGNPLNSPPYPFIWAVDDNSLPGGNLPVQLDSNVTVDPAP